MHLERRHWNAARFESGAAAGHYESWFQRANHHTRPLGFWIRYTIFTPTGRPELAEGELWAMYFDGETDSVAAAKLELPIADCSFDEARLDATIGDAKLDAITLHGEVAGGGQHLAWELDYTSPQDVLLALPQWTYTAPLPKAKALVGSPNASYTGTLTVNGDAIDIDGWVGSQNHNWGSKHTDRYAWGQVCEFDDAPGSFLEVATAQIKIGPVWTPKLTLLNLRLDGHEYALSGLTRWVTAKGSYDIGSLHFEFETGNDDVRISGRIIGKRQHFVALPYRNPPGGTKTCLNSKIARCELDVTLRGGATRTLVSEHRAAFEILTDSSDHGIPVVEVGDGRGGHGTGRFAG